MAETRRVLGQVDPAAATLTVAYTVPLGGSAVLSGVHVANRAGAPTTFRVNIAEAGAAAATKQYVAYDLAIGANAVVIVGRGITLGSGDVVRVYATLATLSFNIFGAETT